MVYSWLPKEQIPKAWKRLLHNYYYRSHLQQKMVICKQRIHQGFSLAVKVSFWNTNLKRWHMEKAKKRNQECSPEVLKSSCGKCVSGSFQTMKLNLMYLPSLESYQHSVRIYVNNVKITNICPQKKTQNSLFQTSTNIKFFEIHFVILVLTNGHVILGIKGL